MDARFLKKNKRYWKSGVVRTGSPWFSVIRNKQL